MTTTPEALSLAIKALEPFSLYADCLIGETPNSLMVSCTFSVETLRAARTALQSLRQIAQPDSGWRLVPIEVNQPWERLPTCACDPGHGEPPTKLQRLECRARGGRCSNLPQDETAADEPAPAPLDLAVDDEPRPVEPAASPFPMPRELPMPKYEFQKPDYTGGAAVSSPPVEPAGEDDLREQLRTGHAKAATVAKARGYELHPDIKEACHGKDENTSQAPTSPNAKIQEQERAQWPLGTNGINASEEACDTSAIENCSCLGLDKRCPCQTGWVEPEEPEAAPNPHAELIEAAVKYRKAYDAYMGRERNRAAPSILASNLDATRNALCRAAERLQGEGSALGGERT